MVGAAFNTAFMAGLQHDALVNPIHAAHHLGDAAFFDLFKFRAAADVPTFAAQVNAADVLVHMHGAGLTNQVLLPREAVVVQIVPWAKMDWMATNTPHGAHQVPARAAVGARLAVQLRGVPCPAGGRRRGQGRRRAPQVLTMGVPVTSPSVTSDWSISYPSVCLAQPPPRRNFAAQSLPANMCAVSSSWSLVHYRRP
jgi:hypothetical protein